MNRSLPDDNQSSEAALQRSTSSPLPNIECILSAAGMQTVAGTSSVSEKTTAVNLLVGMVSAAGTKGAVTLSRLHHGLARRKPHGYKPYVSVVNPCISVGMTVVFRDEP